MNNRKPPTEREILAELEAGAIPFPPLRVRCVGLEPEVGGGRKVDALIDVAWDGQSIRFAVEMKRLFTPKAFEAAVDRLKAIGLPPDVFPMVLLPYLGEPQLKELEQAGISGIDLCGNGVIIVPQRWFIVRSGQPNRFTTSAPIKNIYRRNSSMVPRVFLARPRFATVSDALGEVNRRNPWVSTFGRPGMVLGTVSKAIKTLEEDLIVSRVGGPIRLVQPDRLLAKLVENYTPARPVATRFRMTLTPSELRARLAALSSELRLPIVGTGLASVNRYAVMQRGDMLSVYCSRPATLAMRLDGSESDRFPNLEILAAEDEPAYFDSRSDEETGFSWAAPVQTYMELMHGDKRDQETAAQVRTELLRQAGGPS